MATGMTPMTNANEAAPDATMCRWTASLSTTRFRSQLALDNGLFGGKEFVKVCRRHAQLGGDIRHRGFSETKLTEQLVGFDHDLLTRFIAGQTFAGKLSGVDKSDEVYYSSHICFVKWLECSWPQESLLSCTFIASYQPDGFRKTRLDTGS